jgi:hypothetical protein
MHSNCNEEIERELEELAALDLFIQDFRIRNKFTLEPPALERRCPVRQEQQEKFILPVQSLMVEFTRKRVIKLDKRDSRKVAPRIWGWAPKGSKSVSCVLENGEKEGITVIVAVDALVVKLPLTMMRKAKTPRRLAALNLPPDAWDAPSESGWATCEVTGILREEDSIRE